jgi:hypothetical protein
MVAAMKRPLLLIIALTCVACLTSTLWAAESAKAAPQGKSPGIELATMASQVTGIAISPLLGAGGVGAYQWIKASTPEAKAALPWFAQVSFWLPALLLVGVCAFKDSFAAMVPPGLKKPLDIAETVENKISGLVAAGAVLPSLIAIGSKLITESAGLGPLSIAVFAVVWVVGHAINVLILLSPWGGVDTALKGLRTAVLSLVTATAYIDPVVGATLSVVIVVAAYFMAGWAFRLMIFGSVFTWDFFTLRHRRFQLLADGNKLFTARPIARAPMRTYGRLHQTADGKLLFKFRPWLVMAEQTVEVPRDGLVVGKGVFFSEVLGFDREADKNRTLLLLPPRYLGHEDLLARTYHISGTCDVGLRKAWSWIKEAFSGKAKPAASAAT